MAHDKSDTRLRRAPLGRADPPRGSVLGADIVRAPLVVERGLPRGSSNPAATDAHLDLERDEAAPPKGSGAPPHPGGPPFELKR